MRNVYCRCGRLVKIAIFIFVACTLALFVPFENFNLAINCAYADDVTEEELEQEINNQTNEILDEFDLGEIDQIIEDGNLFDFANVYSFKDLLVKILSGEALSNYDSIFDFVLSQLKGNLKQIFSSFAFIFVLIVLYKIFASICADKYDEFKKCIKYIFSLIIALYLLNISKGLFDLISLVVNKIFGFAEIIFPILLSLILASGAETSFSIYSGLSVFVLNVGFYVFVYVLLPIVGAILVLSVFDILVKNSKFKKLINLLKFVFKSILIALFSIFGLFSTINVISSSVKDGISLKLTKYAIKNYVPVIGGYISSGYDLIKTCSVIIKNSFGVCGIFALGVMIFSPLMMIVSVILAFKILSVLTAFVDEDFFSSAFENISKSLSYFLTILAGAVLIIIIFIFLTIISVSVV